MRYAIVIEKTEENYSAYAPDLPGCVATGATPEETEANMREAIRFHIDGLLEDGLPVPASESRLAYVEA
jgi:predicted RNase H-like HicB family nuclease